VHSELKRNTEKRWASGGQVIPLQIELTVTGNVNSLRVKLTVTGTAPATKTTVGLGGSYTFFQNLFVGKGHSSAL
jgi:acyl-CoA hydrolase